ncbi:hypothetical protein BCR42DRAFT_451423 [Absidia repens]|uniref:Autophagy-related protein 11 n=1 Tax=Absidia repens TaxID=90262 RepID=A0A1X2IH95_9FUNG|nr:hypothetical protein BCR42DRAFT_451423 [Absidia repens]
MKLYRAETGQHIHWSRNLIQQIQTLDEFKQELEQCTGVPAINQILMTSFGTQVKQDQLRQVLEATGKDEYIVFCYDRYYLGASSEEIATLLDVEMPILEPVVSPVAAHNLLNALETTSKTTALPQHCELYLSLFAKFDSFSQTLMKTVASHTSLAKTLVGEQKSQSMALNVALTNLETHSGITNRSVQEFYRLAEKELDKQSALLESADIDLNILHDTQIHPAFISHGTNNSNSDTYTASELDKQQSLMDYVDMDQLQTARQDTEELCQHLTHDTHFLQSVVGELQNYEEELRHQISSDHNLQTLDTMLMDIQDAREKTQFLRDKIKRDLNRIYSKIADLLQVPLSSLFAKLSLDASFSSTSTSTSLQTPSTSATPEPLTLTNQAETKPYSTMIRRNSLSPSSQDTASAFPSQTKKALEAFYHLAEIHINDYLPKLTSYESTIRQLITKLTQLKRQSIQKFLKNMTTISQLQSDIASTSSQLELANRSLLEFKDKYGSSYLETSRNMVFAYGALMIEGLRRKEYTSILIENANLIADVLGRFREQEQDRRDAFRRDIKNSLPFNISNINDAAPQFEISTSNSGDNTTLITKKDIKDFLSLLDRSYSEVIGQQDQSSKAGKSSLRAANRKDGPYSSHRTQMAIASDSYGQNLLSLLNNMNKQLDGLNLEFLKRIESAFLLDSRNMNMDLATASVKLEYVASTSRSPSEKALELAEDKVKKYEERIISLEKALQQTQSTLEPNITDTLRQFTKDQHHNQLIQIASPSAIGSSSVSSAYSVLDDNEVDEILGSMKMKNTEILTGETKGTSEKHPPLQQQSMIEQEQEIADLKETIRQREAFIKEVHKQLLQEQRSYQDYRDQAEHEKDDMRLRIQEYEQLLEEERQTYEDNRKSFLKEVQVKDGLTDIRVADIESDWKNKVEQLTESLTTEKKIKSDMDNRHHQEIMELKERHEYEMAQSKKQLEISHKNEISLLSKALEELRSEYTAYRQQTSTSKQEADDKLNQLVTEMNNSEEARNEIKQKLAQAREMVLRAENDWTKKNVALEKLKSIHDAARNILIDLLIKYNDDLNLSLDDSDDGSMIELLDILSREADNAVRDRKKLQEMQTLESDYNEACRHIGYMNEEKVELQSLSVQMAHKLDDIRKNIFFEITNQLQLPVDENEVGAMTRKLSIGGSAILDDTSFCSEILTATNVIDIGKFVSRIFKKVRTAHDLTRRWQKEYKELKEKYSKLAVLAQEKISFRNFKVGDVALFLPTKNSTGKPWAAFNVNAPHYFLKPSDAISSQINSREWVVARITSVTEHSVNAQDQTTNPYGLPDNTTFYQLEAENWRNNRQKHHHRKSKQEKEATETRSSSPSVVSPSPSTTTGNIADNSGNSADQRRYSLPNTSNTHQQRYDSGLASISSSNIDKFPTHDDLTNTPDQQTRSSTSNQHQRHDKSLGQFTRSSSGNIVQSTTALSPT